MSIQDLIERLDSLLTAKGLSDRKACLKAREINPAVGVDFLRDMRRRKHVPRADKLSALAQVLEVDPASLMSLVGSEPITASLIPVQSSPVPIVGTVQAGRWQTDYEVENPIEFVSIPGDSRYPYIERFAFKVRGDSMDLLYPDGTIVIAARLFDIAREPRTGDKVIVVKTSNGLEEATLKEVEIREEGQVVLWPRSSNPAHSQAIVLPSLPVAEGFPDDGCHGEYRIAGIVIQSLRPE